MRLKVAHDLLDARFDQGMVAVGLVAEQVVDEQVAAGAVELAVEVQGALPAPDVERWMLPELRAFGEFKPQSPQEHPLAAPFATDRQLLRRDEQVVADLEERRPQDRPEDDDRAREVRRPESLSQAGQAIGQRDGRGKRDPRRRQQVVMGPVEAG
jgi:hypothetical protein